MENYTGNRIPEGVFGQEMNTGEIERHMEREALAINEMVVDALQQSEIPDIKAIKNIVTKIAEIDVTALEKVITAMKDGSYTATNPENLKNLQRACALSSEFIAIDDKINQQGGLLTDEYAKDLKWRDDLMNEIFGIFKSDFLPKEEKLAA